MTISVTKPVWPVAGPPARRPLRRDVSLEDRYVADSGAVVISGVQALVRLALEQRRQDAHAGLRTGMFISGYQGSPLGTLDLEFGRAHRHLEAADIVFRPGLNEELAATAVAGTQALGLLPGRRVDGVTGFWYGKNPGLDRAADAIRHGNLSGTAPLGGAVAWVGDDPASKSSSVPSACEAMCRGLMVPVLAPGTVQEIISLGLHAVALSRHAGVWAALKVVTDVADASQTVALDAIARPTVPLGARDSFTPPVMLPPTNLDAEADLIDTRIDRAIAYVRAAALNAVTIDTARPRLAILGSGFGHQAVVRALADLRIDARHAAELGIRLARISVPWPVDRDEIRRLCGDAETVLVVEDKMPFLEVLVRDALYGGAHAPPVLGKRDADGRPLLPARSFVTADDVARALARLLEGAALPEEAAARLRSLEQTPTVGLDEGLPGRTPYFCSGCPHSTSTKAASDQLVGAGIGCHTMIVLEDGKRRGEVIGLTQMGGEGTQWIGLSPFTDDEHFVQNLGDGTFHHSGSLAIRAAVAAGVNVTYKLLYNDAVAMTGGQRPEGRLDVPAITRLLAAEGVARVVVVTPEPERYREVALATETTVRHRDELEAVQAELKAAGGVTVIVYDDQCATEKRRLRKRGRLAMPAERIWINERVCEGCGDCGVEATCLSLLPVQTEFGRKTQVQQSSCNVDKTCLKGDCPSFLLVTPEPGANARPKPPDPPAALPDPVRRVPDDVVLRMPGVGGTGVVTISAIVQMAAHLEGRSAAGLEQIGLAQKGGPVISDVRISSSPIDGQLRASTASVDVVLGLDLLGAATPVTLAVCDSSRTVAVLNTAVTPTAQMVTDVRAQPASRRVAAKRLAAVTRPGENVELDANTLAEAFFGDHLPANMIMLGAAFQHGCLPLSEDALHEAIRLNGTAVDANLAAFGWGRAAVALPEAVDAALRAGSDAPDGSPAAVDPQLGPSVAGLGLPSAIEARLHARVAELVAYEDRRYAGRYLEEVSRVLAIERERGAPSGLPVTEAFVDGLFKLMAYKDEYEVARLHLDARERHRVTEAFGERSRVEVLLHPPLLRAMGLDRKIRLGRTAFAAFGVLHAARRVRGTVFDPFGRAHVRRVERGLIDEYIGLVGRALARLSPDSAGAVAQVAGLPDVVRGYEKVKLRNVEEFRARARELLDALEGSDVATALRRVG